MKVLLVDDDPALLEVLGAYLRGAGFEVLEAEDGEEALGLFPRADLVILDLMLPKLDGLQVLGEIRREKPELPVLLLTARGAEEERVRGLELGADDYVVKPFSPREVVARAKALLRRVGLKEELAYGPLRLLPRERRPTWRASPSPSPPWSLTCSSPWPSTRAWSSAGRGFWRRSGDRTSRGWTGWWTSTSPG